MTAFFVVFNLILLFRFLVFFLDDRLSGREACAAALALPAMLFLFFHPSLTLGALQVGLVVTVLLSWMGDRRDQRIPIRLWILLIQFVIVGVASSPSFGLEFRPQIRTSLDTWPEFFTPFTFMAGLANAKAQAYVMGLLVCIQEANLFVRWIIESLELKPAPATSDSASDGVAGAGETSASSREYNRGRVIGALERIAVYVLVLNGQYEALGLVLAAKGLARFQNLDNRDFAEYFLIGTFLSVVLAGGVALAIKATF